MIRFISFSFSSDKFYTEKTTVPLGLPGLTLFRGHNYDAVAKEERDPSNTPSNGAGKTRLGQLLEGFIYGKTARGNFKKMVSPAFEGTLEFEDLRTKTHWSFSYSDGEWVVKKNDVVLDAISHKKSDVQGFLQQTIGISRDEWSYFVQIDGDSLRTLIKGKPAERRAYLEDFFNIDSYYVQQLDVYKQKLKHVNEELRLIEQDQVRLSDVDASLEKLPGGLWLERQIEFLKEISKSLQTEQEDVSRSLETLRSQMHSWQEYQRLLQQYGDFEVLREEERQREEEAKLQALRAKAEQQNKLKLFISRELKPHKARKPQNIPNRPTAEEPSPQTITDKKVMLSQMAEKMSVKQALRDLLTTLPEIPDGVTLESVEAERAKFLALKIEAQHRLSICEKIAGRGECPTCGQSLPEDVKGESPEQARALVASYIKEIQRLDGLFATLREYGKKDQEIEFLNKKLASFPVFGATLQAVKQEVADLEALALQWEHYRRANEHHQEWLAKERELEAEARALGYPTLLEHSFDDEIKGLTDSVRQRSIALKESQDLKRLLDVVMTLPSLQTITSELDRLQVDVLPSLKERILEAAELHGSYGFQLRQRKDLLSQRGLLKLRVENYEPLKAVSRRLDVAVSFYAPTGFKLYELKQRCRLLVDRANYWTRVFFQEPYVWSLSEDLDDLNLFVTPSTVKNEDPYPVALLSAGERNRAARVLLFAQLELIPPTKKTNLLFLDEIEANLDETGVKAFSDVAIPKLKETFPERSIVIVSHLKGLKNSGHFDHIWLAERRERKTTLSTYPWYNRKFSLGEISVEKEP